MEEILKAIAQMTILADTEHVPEEEHGQQLDKIKTIGQAILNTRKTVDYMQCWGKPAPETKLAEPHRTSQNLTGEE